MFQNVFALKIRQLKGFKGLFLANRNLERRTNLHNKHKETT